MASNAGRTFKPEPLSVDEAQHLLDSINGDGPLATRNRALVAMLWRSGCRVSELLSLRPKDVDLDAGTVTVLKAKGDRSRIVPIDYLAIPHVRTWLAVRQALGVSGRQRLFCSVSKGVKGREVGKPMHPSYARRLLPQLAARAGIEKRVHPHGLRHTWANELLDRGVPLKAVQKMLGHSHLQTTWAYTSKLSNGDAIEACRAAGMTIERPS
jgi:site-specific recombinase XerD